MRHALVFGIELPAPVFTLALLVAQLAGRSTGLGEAAVRRMRNDLVFDIAPAQRDFGYAPRRFHPTADMFESRSAAFDDAGVDAARAGR